MACREEAAAVGAARPLGWGMRLFRVVSPATYVASSGPGASPGVVEAPASGAEFDAGFGRFHFGSDIRSEEVNPCGDQFGVIFRNRQDEGA